MTPDPCEALDRTVVLLQDYVKRSDDDIVDAFTAFRVRMSVDEQTLATVAGRAALLATFDCIARLGVQVILDVPRIAIALPPGYHGADVRDALLERSRHLIAPASLDGDADLTVAIGRVVESGEVALGGTSTTARLRIGETAGGWEGELPFGAGLAAAAAGAEVTRAVLARLVDGHNENMPFSLDHQRVDLSLPPLHVADGLDLGGVDFVSGGAITNAVLFLLFQIDGIRLQGRVFDDDTAHADNLNRYLLLTTRDLEQLKVEHLENLSTENITLQGIIRRIEDGKPLPEAPLAATVCTGVDWVEGRWAAQELCPGWHGVGATTHAYAMASEHWPGQACAACIHPEAGDHTPRMPTISFVSLLAGTLLAHRLIQHATAPVATSERTEVLDAFNLSSPHTVINDRPAPNPKCRLHTCHKRASRGHERDCSSPSRGFSS